MIYLALGLLLFALSYRGGRWGRRLFPALRGALGVWRPTAGLASAVLLVLALVLGVREDWAPALGLAFAGLGLALSARLRRGSPAPSASGMSVQDARSILGVGPDAGAQEIQAAYRRLIQAVHPDRGGSRGLAAQLNAARDVLIQRASRPAR